MTTKQILREQVVDLPKDDYLITTSMGTQITVRTNCDYRDFALDVAQRCSELYPNETIKIYQCIAELNQ